MHPSDVARDVSVDDLEGPIDAVAAGGEARHPGPGSLGPYAGDASRRNGRRLGESAAATSPLNRRSATRHRHAGDLVA